MSELAKKHRTVRKVSNMRDLEFLMERYKYEIKLNEQSMGKEFSYFRNNLGSAAKETAKNLLETAMIAIMFKLLKR